MSFFRKRIYVDEYWDRQWAALRSPEREASWMTTVGHLFPQVFGGAAPKTWFLNFTAAYVELLSIAVTKTHSFDVAMRFQMAVRRDLREYPDIAELYSQYNSAFGSSPTDGVRPMALAFSKNVSDSGPDEETAELIYEQFYAGLRQFYADLRDIKLV